MSAYDLIRKEFPELGAQPGAQFIECHEGWYELIHFAFQVFDKAREYGEVRISQIKEKFGTLRIYAHTPTELKHRRLLDALLEVQSMNTCDLCGEPGELNKGFGWVATRCEPHTGYRGMVDYRIPNEMPSCIPTYEKNLEYVSINKDNQIQMDVYLLPKVMRVEDFFKEPSELTDLGSMGTVTFANTETGREKAKELLKNRDEFTVTEFGPGAYNAIFRPEYVE